MTDRIEQIKKLLAREPDDVFLNYSLGMEYISAGDFDQAIEAFAKCESIEPAYLPAKIEMGKALRSAGRLAEARDAFTRALQSATAAGQQHAMDNIQAQLDSLPGTL